MAEDRIPTRKISREEQYLKLLKGEVSSAEFVKGLEEDARSNSRLRDSRRRGASTTVATDSPR